MAYADVNGLSLYYEEHGGGDGTPLILLHRALGGGELFAPVLPELSAERRVITVDLQAHGHTADIDRPIRAETCADDIAALIRHLGLEQADVLGHSLGGWIGLRMAIQHSELVRRLVVVSVALRPDGWLPEFSAQVDAAGPATVQALEGSPFHEYYKQVAPRKDDFSRLVEKMFELLKSDYDYSKEIARIKAPILLAFADADAVAPAHMVEFWGLLGGGQRVPNWDGSGRPASRLTILPGTTHDDMHLAPTLVLAVNEFLG
jgi:pimeloyl-ACP methyl ester carboxylesterase